MADDALDAAREELVRSRGFIRGAETQLTKALDALDAAMEEPTDEEPDDGTTEDPADVEPVVVFDPDQYESTEELLATEPPFGGAELGEDGEKGRIRLDTDVARPSGSQSMRYDYVDQGVGNSLHVGRRMPLPSHAREVWIEAQVRWSENFFAIQDFPDDGSTFAHKFLFGESKNTTGDPNNWTTPEGWSVNRWALHVPGGGSPSPPDGPIKVQTPRHDDGTSIVEPVGMSSADLFDAEWHRIRMHFRHDPGRFWLEIDGEEIVDRDGFTIHPDISITALLLGRNKDDGIESGTESLWWGKVEGYTEDPGW